MARPERFELPTARFVAEYSIQLSYGRIVHFAAWSRSYKGVPPRGSHMVLTVTLQVKLFLVLFDAQSFVHYRARGGVLDVYLFIGFDALLDREGRQRRLVEAA